MAEMVTGEAAGVGVSARVAWAPPEGVPAAVRKTRRMAMAPPGLAAPLLAAASLFGIRVRGAAAQAAPSLGPALELVARDASGQVPGDGFRLAEGEQLTLTWQAQPRTAAEGGALGFSQGMPGFTLQEVRDAVTLLDGAPLVDWQPVAPDGGRLPVQVHTLAPDLSQTLAAFGADAYLLRRIAVWRDAQGREVVGEGTAPVQRAVAATAVARPPVAAWYYLWAAQPDDVVLAEQAGIDALIVSETTVAPSEVLPPQLLQRVRGRAMRLTLGVEIEDRGKYPTREATAERLGRAVRFAHGLPQWLRVDGRPVLVFWNLPAVPTAPGERPQDAWSWIRGQADPGHTTIWIAEGGDTAPGTGTLTYLAGDAFDGLHLYSIAWAENPGQQLANWAARVRATGPGRYWAATVSPGGTWGAGPNATALSMRDRQEGAYYRRTWDGATATNPDLVVITSWNEFPEKTAIRPHPTNPEFGYGALYLDLTRELAQAAKARAVAR